MTFAPLFAFGVLFALGFARLPFTTGRAIGLALATLGFIGLTVARFHLGNSFSVAPKARRLVTHGIYSKIRHPVYVFSSIAIAGALIFFDLDYLLFFFIAIIPIQIVRARKEEAVLENAFGDEYREYRRRTWF